MAVRPKPPKAISRPSSLYIERVLNTHRNNKKKFPTRIWYEDEHHQDPSTAGHGEPTLKLSHPILRALESCRGRKAFDQVQAQLVVSGLSQHSLASGRAIKKLCSSPTTIDRAVSLFSHLVDPDAFICNTIIRSFLNSNNPERALGFYHHHMLRIPVTPNHYTFPLLAKLFAELGLVRGGESTHARIAKLGFELDLFVRNSLVHMYSSFGHVDAAFRIFESGLESDAITWNSMIDGCVKNGMVEAARWLFDDMPERDVVSWNVMIAGHAGVGDVEAAKELFLRMPERDVISWNSMIDGYAKIGEVTLAQELFDSMPNRNLVSWNIMLALYSRVKNYRECLNLFDGLMAVGDSKPNEATLVSVLTACANLGELDRGKWVHSLINDSNRKIETDVLLSTALLTMYAKCGVMDLARSIFDQMPERSVVSWNSMIIGYGMHGHSKKALELFLEMEKRGPRPNETTFVCIFSACTHGGMVLEGWWCFDRMIRFYGIEPKVEHFGSMVDLLSRAGLMRDSEELIKKMTVEPAPALWGALLSACRTHSNLELAELVSRKLIELEPRDVGPYVLLSNIYAAEGRWDDVEKVRKMMRESGLQKTAGVSLVGSSETGFDPFLLEQRSVHKKSMVYSMLGEMGAHMKLSCRDLDERQTDLCS